MIEEDIVCTIELTLIDGTTHTIALARRADPVAELDKFLQASKISRTDIAALFCRARESGAITLRACEAVTALVRASF